MGYIASQTFSLSGTSHTAGDPVDTSGWTAKSVSRALDRGWVEWQDDASDVVYDNDTSGLTATDVQAALDEIVARVVALETP
jgi:hypothetical protein